MGLMDLAKKAFLGATDEENRKNKARMREIFNNSVPNGDEYKLIYCHSEDFTDAIVVKITKHSNFIVGYKEGEVVVIPVEPDLKNYGDAIIFNRDNGSHTEGYLGYCKVFNAEYSFHFVPVTYEPGLNRGAKYSVSVTQSNSEVAEFRKFFKKGL